MSGVLQAPWGQSGPDELAWWFLHPHSHLGLWLPGMRPETTGASAGLWHMGPGDGWCLIQLLLKGAWGQQARAH